MKASELRIGNYVYECYSIAGILGRKKVAVDAEYIIEHSDSNFLESIPLTGEWLEMFGFIGNSIEINGYDINVVYFDIWRLVIRSHDDTAYLEKNDYFQVHQLQNIIKSITGEELTIKNKAF